MLLQRAMVAFLIRFLLTLRVRFKARERLAAENILLRQQVIVLRRRSRRVRLRDIVWLYRLFPSVLDAIVIVKPETVIRWHARGFRSYWRRKSRRRGGRSKIDREIRGSSDK